MIQVLTLIAEGFPLKEIAIRLKISTKTVQFHWGQIKRKLGLLSYVDVCRFCLKNGLTKL